jgi:hypothetical protein
MWNLWWTKRHWGRFSPSTSVSPVNHHSTNFSIIISPGAGTIDLLVAAVPSGPNWTPPPTTPNKKNRNERLILLKMFYPFSAEFHVFICAILIKLFYKRSPYGKFMNLQNEHLRERVSSSDACPSYMCGSSPYSTSSLILVRILLRGRSSHALH